MASFVFQLEGVLRQRRNIEQSRMRELAGLQERMGLLEADLRAMDRQVQEAMAYLRQNGLLGRLDMAFLSAHRRYTLAMQRRAMTQVQRMAVLQRQIDEAQIAVREAAKRRKAIEKLRENQYWRWRQTIERHELAENDEVGMQIGYENLRTGVHR
jgi:flagellar export protein FliJ